MNTNTTTTDFQTKLTTTLEAAKDLKNSRETSLVVTKLEEALHWFEASKTTTTTTN